MVALSVNVNKIGTLRNSRGSDVPRLMSVVSDLLKWGAEGVTVHPRPDGRHILYQDVLDIKKHIKKWSDAAHNNIEFNVEGYPSKEFLTLIDKALPHQCTLVPDPPEALTSSEGWNLRENFNFLKEVLSGLKNLSVRSSLFIDPLNFDQRELDFLEKLFPDRVEFYTGAYAKSFLQEEKNNQEAGESFQRSQINKKPFKQKESGQLSPVEILNIYKKLAQKIQKIGIGINAGHDLNQKNLPLLMRHLPFIKEVSVGHAFVCEALYQGMKTTLNNYTLILRSSRHSGGGIKAKMD